jgi:hypothetical protein
MRQWCKLYRRGDLSGNELVRSAADLYSGGNHLLRRRHMSGQSNLQSHCHVLVETDLSGRGHVSGNSDLRADHDVRRYPDLRRLSDLQWPADLLRAV